VTKFSLSSNLSQARLNHLQLLAMTVLCCRVTVTPCTLTSDRILKAVPVRSQLFRASAFSLCSHVSHDVKINS